jgi:hypothetical protein
VSAPAGEKNANGARTTQPLHTRARRTGRAVDDGSTVSERTREDRPRVYVSLMSNLLLIIIVLVLLFGWGGGMAFHVGGNLIHLLLVVLVVVVIIRLVQGRGV